MSQTNSIEAVTSWAGGDLLPAHFVALAVAVLLGGVLVRLWRARRRLSGTHVEANTNLWPAEIRTYRRALPKLALEVARVRRYGRSLAVLVVKPWTSGDGASHGLAFPLAAAILRDALRECDIAAYDPVHNHFVVLLPDSDGERGKQAAARLEKLILQRTALRVRAGTAEFPRDGLIIDVLVRRALAAFEERPQAAPQERAPRTSVRQP